MLKRTDATNSRNGLLPIVAEWWGFDISDVQRLEDTVDEMRKAYRRVELLASKVFDRQADKHCVEPRKVKRVAGSDPHGAWMFRVFGENISSGPLNGVKFIVKDSINVRGVPMTLGGDLLDNYVPSEDAEVVRRFIASGAQLIGTAVCEDLCLSGSSFTSATGPVHNPYHHGYSAGGSSSGCGVLIATGEADIAIGTDVGGSVRNPAAWCGILGLKPTFDLIPYVGALPTETSMDHIGLLARKADVLARSLDVAAGLCDCEPRPQVDGSLKVSAYEYLGAEISGLRVGVVEEGFEQTGGYGSQVNAVVRQAAKRLEENGVVVRSVTIPLHRRAADIHMPISTEGGLALLFDRYGQGGNNTASYNPEFARYFGNKIEQNPEKLPVNAKAMIVAGSILRYETKGRVMALCQALRRALTSQYNSALEGFDVLLMPTVPAMPHHLPVGEIPYCKYRSLCFDMHKNNCATNLTGHPALNVPCGTFQDIPIGMLLVGKKNEDHVLLNIANYFQTQVYHCPEP